MATKYIEKFASTTEFLNAASDTGSAAGLGSVSGVLYANVGGAAYRVEDGRSTVITPAGATTLTAAQSGSEIILNAAAGFEITLPLPAAGLRYRFTVGALFATTNFTIVTNGSANIIQGGAEVAGAVVAAVARDVITFVATAESIGDFADLWSDGTSWFVMARAITTGGITFGAT